MEFNLFKTFDDDFQTILKNFGQKIRVNNNETKAVITNTPLQEFDDKYVSTLTPLKRGDHIIFNDREWYVINEVETKRYDTYKAIIHHAEYRIRFNVSQYNTSKVYSSFDVKEFPTIVSTSKYIGVSYSSNSGIGMYLPEGQLSMIVQDNNDTRKVYQAVSSPSDSPWLHNVIFSGRAWKIIGADITKQGLINFNILADTFTSTDDKMMQIAWVGMHTTWNGNIDTSFYSDSTTINTTPNNASNSVTMDGSIDVSYSKDVNATKYRLTLYKADNSVVDTYVTPSGNVLAFTFAGLKGNMDYYVTVEVGINGIYQIPVRSITVNVRAGLW